MCMTHSLAHFDSLFRRHVRSSLFLFLSPSFSFSLALSLSLYSSCSPLPPQVTVTLVFGLRRVEGAMTIFFKPKNRHCDVQVANRQRKFAQ